MEVGIISQRYAQAIYEYALEKNSENELYDDMCRLISNFEAHSELGKMLANPVLPASDKARVLNMACGDAPSEVMRDAIRLITGNKRNAYTEYIARFYTEFYRKEKGIKSARLTTVSPISEKTRGELEEIVKQHIGCRSVEIESLVDEDIIGGFTLEVDSLLLNASVKKQLAQLRTELKF